MLLFSPYFKLFCTIVKFPYRAQGPKQHVEVLCLSYNGLNLQRIVCSLLEEALFLVSADGREETFAMLAGNIQSFVNSK